jgi:hypothetical protein
LPCWNVKRGYGSFLTLEFGNPSLKIREPIETASSLTRVRELAAKRLVSVSGQWHLWVYCCAWQIFNDDVEIACWESDDEKIDKACWKLDGQALVEASLTSNTGEAEFRFDLGGILTTAPYDDELNEQWLIYCPDGNVFTYRSDGAANYAHGDLNPKDEKWVTIA